MGWFLWEGEPVEFRPGDSIAVALLRAGIHPTGGGCICLGGDCPHCLAVVDGVAYVRTCQTSAHAGLRVDRQPAGLDPPMPSHPVEPPGVERVFCDLVVIGQGESGRHEAESARAAGLKVATVEAQEGEEAVAIYPGPMVVVRTESGIRHLYPAEVVVATGAAEQQPVGPGSQLAGIYTQRAAEELERAGVDLGRTVTLEPGQRPSALRGEERVEAVVLAGGEMAADSVVVDLGLHPRTTLARMGYGLNVRVVGDAAGSDQLPEAPQEGVVCPCSRVTVEDLRAVWERGFTDMELLKRATLAGTGTCQGAVCLPYLRAFIAGQAGTAPEPFTARPLARQITMAEAAAGYHLPPMRRTALHDEHLERGAVMDRFGGWWRPWRYEDVEREYRAVREAVSVGDVSTLGKFIVSGPDATGFLEKIYPCRVADLRPGRSRYTLLLDERGYVVEDGLICRESSDRYYLTFTSAGATFAELWLRDWAETFGADVRILDRTMAVGAINLTGPLAKEVLARAGVADPPPYLSHGRWEVAGVACQIFRLSFTGEASFELHHPAERSVELWRALLELGGDFDIYPHGIDALFGLRLEKGHIIIGMDTEFDSTPRRLGMNWAVKMDKPEFVGREATARTNLLPLDKQLAGWECEGPAPMEGAALYREGVLAGQVTSSRFSSTLGKSVMLGWVRLNGEEPPEAVECEGRELRRARLPFYDPEGVRARS